MQRLKLALALGAVIAVGEGLAAAAVGAAEPELLALQVGIALALGLALALVPLPARWLAVLPVLGAGLFHVANLGIGLDRVSRGKGLGFLAAHAAVVALGLGWCAGSWGRSRREPAERPWRRALPVAAAAYAAQALWCALVLFPLEDSEVEAIAWVALLCASLAPAGAGLASSLALRSTPRRSPRLAGLVALVALIAAPLPLHDQIVWSSHTRLAPPEAAAAVGLPDVLFLVMDTTRADRMSLYGYGRPTTPRLEELARGATVYERAISQAVWTLPSHGSMFTGLYPAEHGAEWEVEQPPPVPERAVTLAERFRAAGYRTACISANHLFGPTFGLAQGFEVVWAEPGQSSHLALPWLAREVAHRVGGHSARQRIGALERNQQAPASEVRRLALRWLERTDGERRFLFLNFMEAHGMLRIPPGDTPRFGEGVPMNEYAVPGHEAVMAGEIDPDPAAARRLGDWYDSQLAFLDSELGRLFDELRRRGVFDGSLIALASDHGEMLGEHRSFNHRGEVWEGLLRVPLILKLPGQREGTVCPETVETSDLAAALPLLAGLPPLEAVPEWAGSPELVPPPVLEAMVGPSNGGPFARGAAAPCPLPGRTGAAFSSAALKFALARDHPRRWDRGYVAVRDGETKFVEDDFGNRAVFDLDRDPGEMHPRAPTPEEAERMDELLGAWRASLREPGDGEPGPSDPEVEAERLRAMRRLGYIGRD